MNEEILDQVDAGVDNQVLNQLDTGIIDQAWDQVYWQVDEELT